VIRRVVSRLLLTLFVLWGVVSLAFVINYALPGDPARAIAGPQARPADVARIRTQLGLDRSLAVEYAIFWRRFVHLGPSSVSKGDKSHASCSALGVVHIDLGMSYQQRKPVAKLLAEKLPATLWLALAATIVQVVVGVTAGTLAAARRGSALDHGAMLATLLGVSAPTFFTGIGLQYLFAYKLRVLPFDGFGQTTTERAVHVILPALTLGLFGAAYYARLVRDEVLSQRAEDYARTARAKGASEARVLVVHVLRNALMPLVTMIGLDLGAFVGGAIITETLFRWPGMGALSVKAVLERDAPVVMGTVIVAGTAIVLSNVLVDISYALLDPRTRARASSLC
jgi:peptide/nickel transport system permease protein